MKNVNNEVSDPLRAELSKMRPGSQNWPIAPIG